MNKASWIGCIIAAVLFVSSVVVFIAAAGAIDTGTGDIVAIRGLGNSGNTIYAMPSARGVAKLLKLGPDAPVVTEDLLHKMVAAVCDRGLQGEVAAVYFAADLLEAQRAAAKAQETTEARR